MIINKLSYICIVGEYMDNIVRKCEQKQVKIYAQQSISEKKLLREDEFYNWS